MRRSDRSWGALAVCARGVAARWLGTKGVTYDAGGRVHCAAERVDGDYVRCLLVPRPVFAPVARGDFFPRVVEVDGLLEVLHGDRVPGSEGCAVSCSVVVFACPVRGVL
jgi:hypothetical protein